MSHHNPHINIPITAFALNELLIRAEKHPDYFYTSMLIDTEDRDREEALIAGSKPPFGGVHGEWLPNPFTDRTFYNAYLDDPRFTHCALTPQNKPIARFYRPSHRYTPAHEVAAYAIGLDMHPDYEYCTRETELTGEVLQRNLLTISAASCTVEQLLNLGLGEVASNGWRMNVHRAEGAWTMSERKLSIALYRSKNCDSAVSERKLKAGLKKSIDQAHRDPDLSAFHTAPPTSESHAMYETVEIALDDFNKYTAYRGDTDPDRIMACQTEDWIKAHRPGWELDAEHPSKGWVFTGAGVTLYLRRY